MLKKNKSADLGPGWFQIGLGAALSVLVGAVLGAAFLATKPVKTLKDAKEIPKDAPSGAVYFIDGKHDIMKTTSVNEKRKRFVAGEGVSIGEAELNVLLGSLKRSVKESAPVPPPAKPGDKAPPPEPKLLDFSNLSARIADGRVQFATTVTYNIQGITGNVIVQTKGYFARDGGSMAFIPERTYVGALPVDRIPMLRTWVFRNLLFGVTIPDDLYAAWLKVTGVAIEGSTLQLKMP